MAEENTVEKTDNNLSDNDGELSVVEKDRIVSFLDRISPELNCEVCGQDNWGLNDMLASPLLVSGDQKSSSVIRARSHPCAMLHCLVCGNTKFFSLFIINEQPSLNPSSEESSVG